MKDYKIDSVDSVLDFFQSLYTDYDYNFHPDDEIDMLGLTIEENERMNGTMLDCFTFCEDNGLDIYGLASKVQQGEWAKRRLAIEEQADEMLGDI